MLDGLHANTQIPKVIGAAREYKVTGNTRYRDIATYFWDRVARVARTPTAATATARISALSIASPRHLGGDSSETLQHLQHAQADAAPLRLEPVGRDHGLLRAGPLQPHPGLAGSRHWWCHLLLPAQTRRLEVLLAPGIARSGVASGQGWKTTRSTTDTIYFHDAGALLCQPLHPQRADVGGARVSWSARRPGFRKRTGRTWRSPPSVRCVSPCACDTPPGRRRDSASGSTACRNQSTRRLAPTSQSSACGRRATPWTSACRCRCASNRCRAPPIPSRFFHGPILLAGELGVEGLDAAANAMGPARRRSRKSPRWRCQRWSLPIRGAC